MGSMRLAPIRKNKQRAELGGEHVCLGAARHVACINSLRVRQTEGQKEPPPLTHTTHFLPEEALLTS